MNPPSLPPLTIVLFFLGAFLCFPHLYVTFGLVAMISVALLWTAAFVAARRAPWRIGRWIAIAFSAVLYVASVYGAVLFTTVLGWSLPGWAIALIVATLLATVVTSWRAWRGIQVPAVVPLGFLITLALTGWWREGGRIRCDDFLRVLRQPDVEVIVPSHEHLAACRPGATLPLRRYPRQIWEAADRKTIAFTTQKEQFADETPHGFDGAFCLVQPGPGGRLRCVGTGKGDGMVEIAPHHRLLGLSWGGEGRGGEVYALPLDDLFAEPALIRTESAGSGIYDAGLDVIYVIGNDGGIITPVGGADLKPSTPVRVEQPMLADYGYYEQTRHEGILCGAAGPIGALSNGGRPYLAVIFRGAPLELQDLGDSMLGWLAFSFGCDWDPVSRHVFVALPNLGAVAEIEYDTGRLLSVAPADVGLRFLRFDPRHRRIYAGDFLRGSVVELEADSKRETRRWFVGRFVRDIRVTRDGGALLVATNLGVVRIRL